MTHEQFPQYNYSEPYFSAPLPGSLNLSISQWSQQGSAVPVNPGPRVPPSIDVFQSRSRAISNPRSRDSSSFNQPNVAQQSSQADHNLDGLVNVPRLSSGRNTVDVRRAPNPITRFYEGEGPWNPVGAFSNSRTSPRDVNFGSQPIPNLEFMNYRNPPGSEIGSNCTAAYQDSGYGTQSQPTTQSIASIEPREYNQDIPEISLSLNTINFAPGSSGAADLNQSSRSDSSRNLHVRNPLHRKPEKCARCGETPKCPSDFRKHILKHEKPFKCEVPNCRRGSKGFTTVNDLNRHKKSVHRIGVLTKSYQCASEHCRNKEKIWPRLDNFKQHVHRMHSDENEANLIKHSELRGRAPMESPTLQAMSVAPMDTTLAGIGTEQNLSIPTFNSPNSLTLTPGQTSRSWDNLEVSSQEFQMDDENPETGDDLYTPGSRQADLGFDAAYRQADQAPSSGLDPTTPASWRSHSSNSNISLGLSTLAAVACSAPAQAPYDCTMVRKPSQQPPTLSGEPQTKAEQQRKALGQLSRAIAANISTKPETESLDNAVWRVLSRATGLEGQDMESSNSSSGTCSSSSDNERSATQSNATGSTSNESEDIQDTITRTEVLKGLAALAGLIKKKGKKTLVGNRQKPFPSTTETCHICKKVVPRRCDLKKHMKRHTRPYGCTFPKCKKSFGSKNDWKRHENSQHFQLETWRCGLPGLGQPCCAELFYRREMFEEHLRKEHHMDEVEDMEHQVRVQKIGRNGQGQFWCGFCRKIVLLKKKRNEAWDERFNHIDEHFKLKKSIEEWLCLEAKKTKGEVLKEMNRNNFDEDEGEMDEGLCDNSPLDSHSSSMSQQSPQEEEVSTTNTSKEQTRSSANSRKRQSSTELPSTLTSRGTREIVLFCCQCTLGPWLAKTCSNCIDCDHKFCNGCSRKIVINDETEGQNENQHQDRDISFGS